MALVLLLLAQFIRALVCLSSELVSALVRVLPQPASEHLKHGRERPGSSRQGTAAAPGGLRHHLAGNGSCTQPYTAGEVSDAASWTSELTVLQQCDDVSLSSSRYFASPYLSQLYVWPLLETLFSEVLTRDEWLRLFDSVFSNHPSFLLVACVAYITCCREPLLLCSQKQDFEVTTFFPQSVN